ncbi:recombinase family protein [Epibacterium sp. SM1979]|uniref:Recombinase family protein n=1 Tax=Tritonibacter litoralis TaxID=2662264 RepID=A0A843YFL3_9RHOB|nr:recombinase family protein [Tritonibacter litoralis]MQQ10270.1 recombinase family protein [Tritonibacter litoralis]
MVEYVVYFRVSTERQGRSGLGLEAQRTMVEQFLQPNDNVIAEFTEVQSGKRNDRVELWKAINLVKKTRSKLLIPKLDRFSRKVSFISGIIDQGIELVVCEHPNVSTFFLHLLACFAEEERRQISERTKAALQAAKARGTILGRNAQRLAKVRQQEKQEFYGTISQEFETALAEAGSFSGTAKLLNARGVKTRKGGKWHPQTVKNYAASLKGAKRTLSD